MLEKLLVIKYKLQRQIHTQIGKITPKPRRRRQDNIKIGLEPSRSGQEQVACASKKENEPSCSKECGKHHGRLRNC